MDFDTLLRRVWANREKANANLVHILVRSLRRKLGDSADSPAYIFNQRGVGYRMAKPGCRIEHDAGAAHPPPAARPPLPATAASIRRASV